MIFSQNEHAWLEDEARVILRQNDRGGYTVPNNSVYPYQWNWDSAFVAMGFALFDPARAWAELERLFEGQWPNGMVPSIVFHGHSDAYYPGPEVWQSGHMPPTTGISQPPVAASAAAFLLNTARSEADQALAGIKLKMLFPKLLASHRWWHEARDLQGSGLVAILHPWESGRDNSPDFDGPLARMEARVSIAHLRKDRTHVNAAERPTDEFYNKVMTLVEEAKALGWRDQEVFAASQFRVVDAGVQLILLKADRDLLALATHLGEHTAAAEIASWLARASAAVEKLRGADGIIRSFDARHGMAAHDITSASFLSLYAGVADANEAEMLARLYRTWKEALRFGVPSLEPSSSAWDKARYWRGPVWPVVNFMIAQGFAAYGFANIAEEIYHDTLGLIAQSGFREYFDPETGEGLGGRDFSWTAAMALVMRREISAGA